jgi:hypothetical protein
LNKNIIIFNINILFINKILIFFLNYKYFFI